MQGLATPKQLCFSIKIQIISQYYSRFSIVSQLHTLFLGRKRQSLPLYYSLFKYYFLSNLVQEINASYFIFLSHHSTSHRSIKKIIINYFTFFLLSQTSVLLYQDEEIPLQLLEALPQLFCRYFLRLQRVLQGFSPLPFSFKGCCVIKAFTFIKRQKSLSERSSRPHSLSFQEKKQIFRSSVCSPASSFFTT